MHQHPARWSRHEKVEVAVLLTIAFFVVLVAR